ncbi:amylosucrase [Alkalispirochaeta americana]|uniref:Amylosucrase n=1 Tax=Alkalispirochaeta americana TaxID=159291 RepID=A0A1N6UH32_9SPIO|nr:amylosucrase [Alkalispirochaeta americana]SIQ64626.1 amylosucrase [Alkalispirochaeta americana]
MRRPFPRRAEADFSRFLEKNPQIEEDREFSLRLASHYADLYRLVSRLYGASGGIRELVESFCLLLWQKRQDRDSRLRQIDRERVSRADWYRQGDLAGIQLYVDRFARTIPGVTEELDYFQDLGVNMLHLMPLLKTPRDHNDGGYAVSDYGGVQEDLGTMEDLRKLSCELHQRGMVLALDYVLNHTSDEHPWAQAARAGEGCYQGYYFTYLDREIPDRFDETMAEVFPETAPGNFTWIPEMNRWVMTVFHRYQWDLNYANPRVTREMVGILLDLANQGVDILRLDAVPYLWKRLGTSCQNLPEAHLLLRLLNVCARIAAPGLVFIAEAIVQPREIARYFGEEEWAGRECELAYNASLMVLLWDAVATGRSALLQRGLRELPHPPGDTAWLNYVRCHDDIGLGYDDHHLRDQGWDPRAHRDFMVRYFTGEFPGSPARGLRFMYNPRNGDARISGTTASLAGIEAALELDDPALLEEALALQVALHGVIFSLGGVPIVYAGDELGLCNDYSFADEPHLAGDNRWVHRPWIHREDRVGRLREGTVAHRIFHELQRLLAVRRSTAALRSASVPEVIRQGNPHVLSYVRTGSGGETVLVLMNCSRAVQQVGEETLLPAGLGPGAVDIAHRGRVFGVPLRLEPYDFCWLTRSSAGYSG